ncbi:MAG: ABC transporter ATP-binding protein [Armatimonadota bacterium]
MARNNRRRRWRAFQPIQGELGRKEAFRHLFAYMKPLRGVLCLALLATTLWVGINIGSGYLLKGLFDILQQAGKKGVAADISRINWLIGMLVLVYAVRVVLFFAMQYSWAYSSNRLTLRMRNDIFAHLQRMSFSFFDRRKTGQLMSSLSSDVPQVSDVLDALKDAINAPLTLVGGTLLLFWLNWKLAFVALICVPAIAFLIRQATKRVEKYVTSLQDSRARVLDVAEEALSSVRTVQCFGNEEHEIAKFRHHSHEVARNVLRNVRVRSIMKPTVEFTGMLALLVIVWIGSIQAVRNPEQLTFGDLVWFLMVLKQVTDGAKDCGNISLHLSVVTVAADRVFTLLNMKSEIQDRPDAREMVNPAGRVEFEHVDFAYQPSRPVLKDVSFSMERGQVVAVVGPTGAGKTTIAALIPRFYDVTGGAVRIDGLDIRQYQLASLRKHIGIVPQDTVLFAGSLRDNIAYGRVDATLEEITAAAKAANAWEFIEKLPRGLNTMVGERGVMLSGGQRQRIAIARAILRNPTILILDEATSSLDNRSERLVQDALQRLMQHRTTLVIAHRLSTVRNADLIIVLKDGEVVERGRHDELIAADGLYATLYQSQFLSREAEALEDAAGALVEDALAPERSRPSGGEPEKAVQSVF